MKIVIPQKTTYEGEILDGLLDKLRTIHLALTPDNEHWHDEKSMQAAWGCLEQAINDLQMLRDQLDAEVRREAFERAVGASSAPEASQ